MEKSPCTCPKCGTRVEKPTKTWTIKGRVEGNPNRHNIIKVMQYRCPKCTKAFRKGIPQKGGENA